MSWADGDDIPIGMLLARAARTAERAFDRTVGGGSSRWKILRTLMTEPVETQSELADTIGVRGATLVHHLDALEAEGLVERRRSTENRRLQTVTLTEAGRAKFNALLADVLAYDARLRAAIGPDAVAELRAALHRIEREFADEG